MNYIEAPSEYLGNSRAVFLAGGIAGAENWQTVMVELLENIDATVLNPRREDFPMGDAAEGERQIEWEHRHLERADLVAFWFPPQTLCPITLFELGTCCSSGVPLVVGTEPDYVRRFDVAVQLRLRRPEVKVVDTLDDLARAVREHSTMQGAGQ